MNKDEMIASAADEIGGKTEIPTSKLTEIVDEIQTWPDETGKTPRSAIELAMAGTEPLAVVDHRSHVALKQGKNPYIARKEKIIDEVISSKYSLRRGLLRPERGRMLVARVEWDAQLGSIFLPGETKDMHTAMNMEVVVMACGENRLDPATGRELKMFYTPEETIGKHAVIRQHSGIEFIWYDENAKQRVLYLIGQGEISAWLEAPPGYESEMQNSAEMVATLRYIKSGLAQKALLPAPRGFVEGEERCRIHGGVKMDVGAPICCADCVCPEPCPLPGHPVEP